MTVNIGTRVATVNLAFSTPRKAAIFERKTFQYTTLSKKLHHCTFSEKRIHVFTSSDVLACFSIHCADQKQHPKPDFLTKSDIISFQTCIIQNSV